MRGWAHTTDPINFLPYAIRLVFVEKTAIQGCCLAVVGKVNRPNLSYVIVGRAPKTQQPGNGCMILFFICQE